MTINRTKKEKEVKKRGKSKKNRMRRRLEKETTASGIEGMEKRRKEGSEKTNQQKE